MKNIGTIKNNGKDSNLYEIENIRDLDKIYADNNDTYNYKNYQFTIVRVKNDINGNPIYKMVLSKDNENIASQLKGLTYRCYTNKGYALIQSYNLSDSLERIFSELDK